MQNREPAKENYFYKNSYIDLGRTIKRAFQLNMESVSDRFELIARSFRNDGVFVGIIKLLVHFVTVVALFIFGFFFTAIFSLIHIICLFCFMLLFYLVLGIVWSFDRLILWARKISHVCTECQKSYLFPVYKCQCGREHKRLAPGKYGIFTRTCLCGNKLPASGLHKVEGKKRKELPAACPFCGHEDRQGESVQLVIPIGGGRSSGKTVLINAFVFQFIEELAITLDLQVDPYNDAYNDKMRTQYQMIRAFYQRGESKRTERVTDLSRSSSRDFSFWVRHKSFPAPRLIHVLDIDGETFVEGSENFVPEQYKYCKGTVLVIDPFWIEQFRNELYEELNKEDRQGIHADDMIQNVLSNFVNKLRGVLHLRASQEIEIPVAIAISKIDSGGLEDRIGNPAAKRLMDEKPGLYKNEFDAMDALCREFLREYGEQAFLQTADTEFKNVRFFAFTALGHSLRTGRYHPRGVLPIMEWILGQDAEMKRLWNESRF